MTIFKAYDIRGTYPDQIDEAMARKIGAALAHHMKARCLVVGRDMRTMAPSVQDALIEGINGQGCDVLDIGLASTPMAYYGMGKLPCDGGVVVTASHNPKQYIGFKICRDGTRPMSGETGIKDLERIVAGADLPPAKKAGKREQVDIKADFIDHMLGFVDEIAPMKIAVDYANGMGAAEAPEIFSKVPGLEVINLYEELDGTFPNHEANPLHEPNLDDLRQAVKDNGCTLGLSFDGDADRCAFVDEDGRTVLADLITAILARGFLARHPGKGIIYDLRSSKVVAEEVTRLGGVPVRERVGHSFMKETMRKKNCIGGGELSGHFYFAENYYTDCGVLAALLVMKQLSEEKRTLKDAADELRRYFGTGEINFKVEDKAAKMREIEAAFPEGEIDHLDGVTVTYPTWWVNVRPSNTEPYLRMCMEADDEQTLATQKAAVMKILGTPAH